MEDYYYYYCNNGSAVGGGGGAISTHVPAFGSWDWNSDLPFTQCFESARQARLLQRHSYSESEDRDLYVTGDLYDSDVVTPAMIVLPRRRTKASKQQNNKEKQSWKGNDDGEVMEPEASPSLVSRPTSKPVDGDLYQISPYLLYSKSKKKGVLGFFSSCLLPTCVL